MREGSCLPPWLKIVVVLEDSAKHTPQVPKITVLTPRHCGQSATVMEGLITAKTRAPSDGPAYRSVAAP
jgi:hypothetical protein